MKSKHTIKYPLILTFSGEYKVNKPNDNSGEYVSKEFAEELLESNKELLEALIDSESTIKYLMDNPKNEISIASCTISLNKVIRLIQKHTK